MYPACLQANAHDITLLATKNGPQEKIFSVKINYE